MSAGIKLYTITGAAQELGLTRQRVHQVVQRMGLGIRQGGVIMLTEDEVKAVRNRPDWRALWHDERARGVAQV